VLHAVALFRAASTATIQRTSCASATAALMSPSHFSVYKQWIGLIVKNKVLAKKMVEK